MRGPGFSPAILRDAVLVAIVALLTVQALRRWCGDRYLVPSDSMQPVLYGDRDDGDVVFVDKLARADHQPVHGLVVVEHPQKPGQQLVKRIVATGDDPAACWVDIRLGDVWVGADAQRVRRLAKDPVAALPHLVTWADSAGSPPARAGLDLSAATPLEPGGWRLRPMAENAADAARLFAAGARAERRGERRGERFAARREGALPSGAIGTVAPVDAGFVDAAGARRDAASPTAVHDCGASVVLAALPERLACTIDGASDALTFVWDPAAGALVLWRDGIEVAAAPMPLAAAAPVAVDFGQLDGRVYFVVDGDPQRTFVVTRDAAWDLAADGLVAPRASTWVHVGAIGSVAAVVLRLRIVRDVLAWREPILGLPGQPGEWPRFVPPGHWFLLGDNAFDSRDSRQYGPIPQSTFLGVPRFVLGPWSRMRRLP
jgi:hypothetical protein